MTVDIDSSNTSPSYSPSLPDMASTPNFEVDNILSINNNNKITAKQHQQQHHSKHPPGENGSINENILPKRNEPDDEETTAPAMKDVQRISSETGVASINSIRASPTIRSEPSTMTVTKCKGEGNRLGKYAKINGITSQSNMTNNNVEGSYQCTFCKASFPRLGYLKKHEQVSNVPHF